MSQSPAEAQGSVGASHFLDAQRKLQRMLHDGMSWSGNERNCCFLNTRDDRFADISAVSGFDALDDGRALATVDWDFDGDLDIWQVNRTGPQLRFLRNDNPPGNQFVSVGLHGDGKMVNRDAIGAKVEIELAGNPPEKLVKTLRAGEGYLSQSSKRIHFGLGKAETITHLRVHWPGGAQEEFSGVLPGGHYELWQSEGKARPWTPPRRDFPSARVANAPTTGNSRSFLRTRMPLPSVHYQDLRGRRLDFEAHEGGPLLINLWATWCKPCVGELIEFGSKEKQLRDSGLEILALCVDDDGDIAAGDISKLLKQLRYPFEAGIATPDAINTIEKLNRGLFLRHRRLPVPSSLLLDKQGRLAAIYRGPVTVETLRRDVARLDENSDESRYWNALPFAGRDYGRPSLFTESDLALRLTEQEAWDEAEFYLQFARDKLATGKSKVITYAKSSYSLAVHRDAEGDATGAVAAYLEAIRVHPDFRDAHFNLAVLLNDQNSTKQAIKHYQQALRVAPNYHKAHVNLGVIHAAEQDFDSAIQHYRKALSLVPDHIDTLNNLGNALVAKRQFADAVALFRKAATIQPDDARTNYNIGAAMDAQSDYGSAAEAYLEAIRLDPSHALAHNNLGVALARLRKFDEAERHLRRAIELDQEYQAARNNLQLLLRLRVSPEPK